MQPTLLERPAIRGADPLLVRDSHRPVAVQPRQVVSIQLIIQRADQAFEDVRVLRRRSQVVEVARVLLHVEQLGPMAGPGRTRGSPAGLSRSRVEWRMWGARRSASPAEPHVCGV